MIHPKKTPGLVDLCKPRASVASDSKNRNRARTSVALSDAIANIQTSGGKLSITSVAAAVGVDPSLIHHSYPEVADKIRSFLHPTHRRKADSLKAEFNKSKRIIVELRRELKDLRKDLSKIASINISLNDQLNELNTELQGKLIRISSRSDASS